MRDLPGGRLYSTGAEETAADDHIGLSPLNSSNMIGHLLVADIKTAGDDLEVLTFNKTVKSKLVEKRNDRRRLSWAGDQNTKSIATTWSLRPERRGSGSRSRRTAEQGDELAPPHIRS